jgi:hypothetical protein
MLIVPLPGIALGVLRRKDDSSEELLFVLAIVSLLPIVGAQVNSIRYLGIVGSLFAAWRCYDIGLTQRNSDRLI